MAKWKEMKECRPSWLKKRLVINSQQDRVYEILKDLNLHTVCQSAMCPNIAECFGKGTATFMILGDTCTRNCRFCAVASGEPQPVDRDEPKRLAAAARRLNLKHVVITSVTRDDLPDGGAGHFASTIEALRKEYTWESAPALDNRDQEVAPTVRRLVTDSEEKKYSVNVIKADDSRAYRVGRGALFLRFYRRDMGWSD